MYRIVALALALAATTSCRIHIRPDVYNRDDAVFCATRAYDSSDMAPFFDAKAIMQGQLLQKQLARQGVTQWEYAEVPPTPESALIADLDGQRMLRCTYGPTMRQQQGCDLCFWRESVSCEPDPAVPFAAPAVRPDFTGVGAIWAAWEEAHGK